MTTSKALMKRPAGRPKGEARREAEGEQKRRREAARAFAPAEKKRIGEQTEADQAKRKKETTCGYCSSTWKGGAQWLWCEYCDEVCICAGCQKSGPTSTEFAAHEKTHEID